MTSVPGASHLDANTLKDVLGAIVVLAEQNRKVIIDKGHPEFTQAEALAIRDLANTLMGPTRDVQSILDRAKALQKPTRAPGGGNL